jgi:DNA modification methylase
MEYKDFLKSKQKRIIESGFEVKELNNHLFPFQDFIVKRALKSGKYAIFADTGLGKTIMQLEWAHRVVLHTKKPVLILAPLAVNVQTIEEGKKFGIKVWKYGETSGPLKNDDAFDHYFQRIYISNYEQIDNIDCSVFSGIVLDESSILKNFNGKYRTKLIEVFENTPYKLCCTATPSPNDPMELGNHAQFLDVMSYNEMLAMYFIHDSSDTGLWRLKGHAIELFYEFVSSWSIMLNKPGDIGFSNEGYDLPKLNINQISIETPLLPGLLFGGSAVNATDFNKTLRETESLRLTEVIKIVKSIYAEQIIIWCKQNDEAKNLWRILIENSFECRNVQGSDKPEKKESDLIDFAHGKYQIMITKTQIASFGMNFQNCHYQIFASLDFSFESVYQAMRRSWRFGQTREVNIWMITTDRMINVSQIINEKEKQFKTMQQEITKAVNKNIKGDITYFIDDSEDVKTDEYWVMRGDCVQKIKAIEDNSIDLMIFSPPFADLYTYSNYVEDMGNVDNYDEFVQHFGYLVKELKRTLKPGRLCAVHCMDLPTLKSRDGYMGIKRFSAKIADIFESEDMFLHSEFTIWKDPLLAAVRTKVLGLAHKQVTKDMSMIRMGLADKVMVFKKKGENQTPIQLADKRFTFYIPMHEYDNFPKTPEGFNEFWGFNPDSSYDRITQYSHQVWQRYASPVWMDIDVTNVLQYTTARDKNDEKHICPLQLDVIKRVILLYSNEGETVLSPFGGIGSEGYQSLMMNRKSISIELKKSYFDINVKNHRNAVEQKTQVIFSFV